MVLERCAVLVYHACPSYLRSACLPSAVLPRIPPTIPCCRSPWEGTEEEEGGRGRKGEGGCAIQSPCLPAIGHSTPTFCLPAPCLLPITYLYYLPACIPLVETDSFPQTQMGILPDLPAHYLPHCIPFTLCPQGLPATITFLPFSPSPSSPSCCCLPSAPMPYAFLPWDLVFRTCPTLPLSSLA